MQRVNRKYRHVYNIYYCVRLDIYCTTIYGSVDTFFPYIFYIKNHYIIYSESFLKRIETYVLSSPVTS